MTFNTLTLMKGTRMLTFQPDCHDCLVLDNYKYSHLQPSPSLSTAEYLLM